jgi:hypothetical protein
MTKYRLIAEPAFTGPEGALVTFTKAAEVVNAGPLAALFGPVETRLPAIGEVLTLDENGTRQNPGDDTDLLLTTEDGIPQWYAEAVVERVEEVA